MSDEERFLNLRSGTGRPVGDGAPNVKAWVIVDPATRRGRHPLTGQMRRFSAASALSVDLRLSRVTIRRNNGCGRSIDGPKEKRRGTSEGRNPDQSCEGQGEDGNRSAVAGAHDEMRPMPGVDRGPETAHGEAAPGKEEGQVVTARRPNEGVGGSTPALSTFQKEGVTDESSWTW